jgi:hypothetical protein
VQGIATKLEWTRKSLPSRYKGQALILALITLVVLVVGVIVLFNSGQTVSKKMQLVNTADAAAYSAAVQQARAFNLVAYMNRATVANQVAMAQMVSWYSWTNFTISATDHLKDAVQAVAIVLDITVVGAEFGAALQEVVSVLNAAKSALKAGRAIEKVIFDIATTAIANLDYAYSKASQLVVSPAESVDLVNMTQKIVQLNDPNAQIPVMGLVSLANDANSANGYVRHYTIPKSGTSTGADRFANVVMEARDPFSRERNGHFGFSIGGGPFISAGLSLDKKGGTDLVAYRNWVGIDTLNLHVWHPVCFSGFFDTPKTCHEYLPLAWGGAAAVDQTPSSFATLAKKDKGWRNPYLGNNPEYATKGNYPAYGGALSNGASSSWVLSYPADGGTNNAWIKPYFSLGTVGLPDYDDIDNDKATVPYLNGKSAAENHVNKLDVGPIFTVLVEESTTNVHTSSNINGLGGPPDFDIQDQTVKGKMTAISTAQVYFSRSRKLIPRVFDSRRETGSLFSPYWHARLVETPCSRRLAADAAYGVLGACTP